MPSIGQLLQNSFTATKRELLSGGTWATVQLEEAQRIGRVDIRSVSAGIVVSLDEERSITYHPDEIRTPIAWAEMAEEIIGTNLQVSKERLVRELIEACMLDHDNALLQRMGSGRMISSHVIRYLFTPPRRSPDNLLNTAYITTLAVFLPERTNAPQVTPDPA